MREHEGLFAFLPFILIIAIFYFIVIYPQRKKEKLHQQMLSRLKKGDQVITIGGIYGTVVDVKDDVVILKVNHDVKLKFAKSTIHTLMEKKQEKRRTR